MAAPKEVPYVAPTLRATLADALLWDSFRDFLALGVPGGFMMQLEGNSYDITTLLAGLLGRVLPHCMSSFRCNDCLLHSLSVMERCATHHLPAVL